MAGRPPSRHGAPHGEDEVRTSLLRAAIELFAARGPGNVSVRQIAEAAGVNHGLVHYYFGSKDGLIAASLDRCARDVADELVRRTGPTTELFEPGGAVERHGRLLAHLVLDVDDPAAIQTDHPTQRVLIDRLRRSGLPDAAARRRAAQVSALVLGWQLFGDFLVAAAELEVDDAGKTEVLSDGIDRLVRGNRR